MKLEQQKMVAAISAATIFCLNVQFTCQVF